jgi:hypothetical protein
VERPNTIIQIPKAKIAVNSFIPAFLSRNIGCDNHCQKAPTAGAALKTQILPVLLLICLGQDG